MKSFSQGQFWGRGIEYLSSADAQQLAAFAEFKNGTNYDPYIELEHAFLYTGGGDFVSSNNMIYTKPVVDPPTLGSFAVQPRKKLTVPNAERWT